MNELIEALKAQTQAMSLLTDAIYNLIDREPPDDVEQDNDSVALTYMDGSPVT